MFVFNYNFQKSERVKVNVNWRLMYGDSWYGHRNTIFSLCGWLCFQTPVSFFKIVLLKAGGFLNKKWLNSIRILSYDILTCNYLSSRSWTNSHVDARFQFGATHDSVSTTVGFTCDDLSPLWLSSNSYTSRRRFSTFDHQCKTKQNCKQLYLFLQR